MRELVRVKAWDAALAQALEDVALAGRDATGERHL
jgi:hypothetical protein